MLAEEVWEAASFGRTDIFDVMGPILQLPAAANRPAATLWSSMAAPMTAAVAKSRGGKRGVVWLRPRGQASLLQGIIDDRARLAVWAPNTASTAAHLEIQLRFQHSLYEKSRV